MTQFLFIPLSIYCYIIIVIIVSFCSYISFRPLFQCFLLKFMINLLCTRGILFSFAHFLNLLVLRSFPSLNGMYAGSPMKFLWCVSPVWNGEHYLSILWVFPQGSRGRNGNSSMCWPAAVHSCSCTHACVHNWWLIEQCAFQTFSKISVLRKNKDVMCL